MGQRLRRRIITGPNSKFPPKSCCKHQLSISEQIANQLSACALLSVLRDRFANFAFKGFCGAKNKGTAEAVPKNIFLYVCVAKKPLVANPVHKRS